MDNIGIVRITTEEYKNLVLTIDRLENREYEVVNRFDMTQAELEKLKIAYEEQAERLAKFEKENYWFNEYIKLKHSIEEAEQPKEE